MTDDGPLAHDEQTPPYNQDVDPSAPPAYDVVENNEGNATIDDNNVNQNNQNNMNEGTTVLQASPVVMQQQQEARKVYIVQMPNEPAPIVTIITPDLIGQYANEHIVYPKGSNNANPLVGRAQVIQPLFVQQTQQPSKRLVIRQPPLMATFLNRFRRPPVAAMPDSNEYIVYTMDSSNMDKRTPSATPNKYNLMYGRINLLVFVYLWIAFGFLSSIDGDQTATQAAYCYNSYPYVQSSYYWYSSCGNYDGACDADPLCARERHVYSDDDHCYHSSEDCQCCADKYAISQTSGPSISYYVFLGVNTFRLFIVSFIYGMITLGKDPTSHADTDPDTNKVKLQAYMDYLCDHPVSYFVSIMYGPAGKSMTEAIIYNISFPQTKFLFFNLAFLYIPFMAIIASLLTEQLIYSIALNDMTSTYTTTTTTTYSPNTDDSSNVVLTEIVIIYIVGLVLLFIGFVMNIHRWKKKNQIERENVEKAAASQGKQIVVSFPHSFASANDTALSHLCGRRAPEPEKRKPSERPSAINLVPRWLHFCNFCYFWFLFAYSLQLAAEGRYYWGWYDLFVAFEVFMIINTVRLMLLTLMTGIKHVDNEYNYIINKDTGKVTLRPFMDYLCDHPAGIVICFLYPDANKAMIEALKHNITFPESVPYSVCNTFFYYLPIMVITAVWSTRVDDETALLYVAASVLSGLGIACHAWRFRMKKDWEAASLS